MELTALGLQVAENMAGMAASEESAAVGALLAGLPDEQRWAIDEAVGAYAAEVGRAYFLAGIELGRNPWPVFVEEVTK